MVQFSGGVRVTGVEVAVVEEAIADLASKGALDQRYSTPFTVLEENLPLAVKVIERVNSDSSTAFGNLVRMNFFSRIFSVIGTVGSLAVTVALSVLCYSDPSLSGLIGLGGSAVVLLFQIAQVVVAYRECSTNAEISKGIEMLSLHDSPRTLQLVKAMGKRVFSANATKAYKLEQRLARAEDSPEDADGEYSSDDASSGETQGGRRKVVHLNKKRGSSQVAR